MIVELLSRAARDGNIVAVEIMRPAELFVMKDKPRSKLEKLQSANPDMTPQQAGKTPQHAERRQNIDEDARWVIEGLDCRK